MERKLNDLKKEYAVLQKKYKLPPFDQLNLNFDIERALERETDYLLREIRRNVADKVYLYLKFCEMILNPSNAPFFMFSLIKNLSAGEKKKIDELYKKLAKMDIDMMDLDLNYSEKKEADFINSIFKEWKGINENLTLVVKSFKGSFDKSNEGNSKAYFS